MKHGEFKKKIINSFRLNINCWCNAPFFCLPMSILFITYSSVFVYLLRARVCVRWKTKKQVYCMQHPFVEHIVQLNKLRYNVQCTGNMNVHTHLLRAKKKINAERSNKKEISKPHSVKQNFNTKHNRANTKLCTVYNTVQTLRRGSLINRCS